MQRYFREPLVWFFLIGGLLFAFDAGLRERPDEIRIDDALKQRLNGLWEVQTGRPAAPEELDSLVNNWLKEEVFYREALQLGLDREDSIVRRRMVQKLGFLMEDVQEEVDESGAIEQYYLDHMDRYSLPRRYSFLQLFFASEETALATLDKLKDLQPDPDWRQMGETTMLNPEYVARSARELSSVFGGDFASQLSGQPLDEWFGPVRSSFGYHLVRMKVIEEPESVPFAYVRKKVAVDYRRDRLAAASEKYYQQLLEKYRVIYE